MSGQSPYYHTWKCAKGHQNSTAIPWEEQKRPVIILRCSSPGCSEQITIPGSAIVR